MIYKGKKGAEEILARMQSRAEGDILPIETAVREIISNVRQNGDRALYEYAMRFDGTDYNNTPMKVSESEVQNAYGQCAPKVISALRSAIENLKRYHEKQIQKGYRIEFGKSYIEQIVRPLDTVMLYAPGGTASYPSSVIMNAVPAKLAGVRRICLATPAKNGVISPLTLVAANEAGVDEIYRIGGAQAVAAFAYGTETVPRADKITGPGNAYVATAKRLVFGTCGIDSVAGPSEILIIADKDANPKFIAADMLGQAEHDVLAAAICATDSQDIAVQVEEELARQLMLLDRADTAGQSLKNYGAIVVLGSIDECIEFSNLVAPEHLEILTRSPRELLDKVKNAGGIFLGQYSPEPLGDYLSGTNHILPTGGTARFSSPLGVYDFVKRSSVVCYDKDDLQKVYQDIVALAEVEGLTAHAKSAAIRFERG